MADDDQQRNTDQGSQATDTDTGFPAGTPVAEMTPQQQANYWKTQSRKHEGRATTAAGLLGKLGVTDEAAAQALLEKRDRADALANDLATDTERAAREAADRAKADADATYRPKLVETAFRMAIGDRKTAEQTADFLGDLNLSRFLTDSGDVDTAKVLARVGEFAPATGTGNTSSKGPTVTGHGSGGGKPSNGLSGPESGSDLYDRLHPKKTA